MYIRLAELKNRYAHARRYLGRTYENARVIGRNIDHAMGVGRRVYKTLEPLLNQAPAGGVAVKHIRRGLEGYDELRDQVLGAHRQAQNLHSQLRSSVPELGL